MYFKIVRLCVLRSNRAFAHVSLGGGLGTKLQSLIFIVERCTNHQNIRNFVGETIMYFKIVRLCVLRSNRAFAHVSLGGGGWD